MCLNGGTCSPDPTDVTKFICSCPLFFFGSICQYTVEGVYTATLCVWEREREGEGERGVGKEREFTCVSDKIEKTVCVRVGEWVCV